VIYQASALTFDPSVIEIFTSFLAGAQLLVLPRAFKLDTELLIKLLNENECSILNVKTICAIGFLKQTLWLCNSILLKAHADIV
jgi:non-ribosomal peptide synthetase component F